MKEKFELQQTQFQVLNFEELFRMPQDELKAALAEELKASGYRTKSKKGFLYAPGEVPVMLVAHLDTVHRQPVRRICYSTEGTVMMSPEGIGGDDRAGVYMILRIIQQAKCHVLFCEDEETGGQGARKFTKQGIRPEINFIVEMDRHGDNDAVFYGCCNPEFAKHICSFGFEEAMGSFSDISVIAPHLEVAAVNISAGYYQEHRLNEYVRLDQMEKNAERILRLVTTPSQRFDYMSRSTFRSRASGLEEFTLWSMENREQGMGKKLMQIPETACISVSGQELTRGSHYYIDEDAHVYQFLPELDVAVAIGEAVAHDEAGAPICFSQTKTRTIHVMELEHVLELLQAG